MTMDGTLSLNEFNMKNSDYKFFLGITIDRKLTFNKHIKNFVKNYVNFLEYHLILMKIKKTVIYIVLLSNHNSNTLL